MKKLYISFIFLTYFVCIGNNLCAQSEFVLNGNIEPNQRQVEKVFLELSLPDKILRDSVAVVNGKYMFKGKLDDPVLAYLSASYKDKSVPEVVPVFIEPGDISITHQEAFSNLFVNGSQSHTDFIPIANAQSIIRKVSDSLYAAYRMLKEKGDSVGMSVVRKQMDDMSLKFRATYNEGLLANPGSPIAPYLLYCYSDKGWKDDVLDFDSLLAIIPSRSLNTPTGKTLLESQQRFPLPGLAALLRTLFRTILLASR